MNFDIAFSHLTGNSPFPWQQALYENHFCKGTFPSTCNLPTGLGKTSVVAIWLIALANHPEKVPRRLVYVVNRRTVVDQTTAEVEKYRDNLKAKPELRLLREKLAELCAVQLPELNGELGVPLALSTLRGQFADNREWSADPTRPAVIAGTVDMIGSRLLFSGYGIGFKSKPLHAGFLGQDVLLIHDEAHLEPAFQKLLLSIEQHQQTRSEFRKFHVVELSATSRGDTEVFNLTAADRANEIVAKRTQATKAISLHEIDDEKGLADKIAALARNEHTKDKAVLIFVRKVDDVEKIVKQLPKDSAQQLTGTLRGYERDRMADPRKKDGCAIFARFVKRPSENAPDTEKWNVTPKSGTVYLVCTSAGEVGVNISADHLVCDLSTFDSMAQRFGRLNRFGDVPDAQLHIVHPTTFDETEIDVRRSRTLAIVRSLDGDGSPDSLGRIPLDTRLDAFAPIPPLLPTPDSLFDSWALTTIKGLLPARPPVEPYLHGADDDQDAETYFAWREEVDRLTGRVTPEDIEELLENLPLKPLETLRVTTYGRGRAYDQLQKLADRVPELPVWVIEPDGTIISNRKIQDLVAKRGSDYSVSLIGRTVVLPPKAGGLTANGTLNGSEVFTDGRGYDVVGKSSDSSLMRFAVSRDEEGRSWLVPVATIDGLTNDFNAEVSEGWNRLRNLNSLLNEMGKPAVRAKYNVKIANPDDEDGEAKTGIREYLILQAVKPTIKNHNPSEWPALADHLTGVSDCARQIAARLKLDGPLIRAIELAGAWHDLGKGRGVWQRGAGNSNTQVPVSKPIHGRPPENLNRYRHELGSLIDVYGTEEYAKEFAGLTEEQRDIVLHLIAAHHGRGRPHFPGPEADDVERPADFVESVVSEVPSRFARMQRRFGRWGLAYLESILRASDVIDSQRIESNPLGEPLPGEWPKLATRVPLYSENAIIAPSIRLKLDPSNPGQFFACCGLLELAHILWPGTMGWFEGNDFLLRCHGTLEHLLAAFGDCQVTNTMTPQEWARFDQITSMSVKERKNCVGAEDEHKALEKAIRESPVVLSDPLNIVNITINWFADEYAGGSRFKTWAGRQSVYEIAKAMKGALTGTDWRTEDCLFFTASECGLPFNFDANLGSQGGAIDVGFSFDPLAGSALTRIESTVRPALELLAFVGLQRFRATELKGRFVYTAWNRPLPVELAAPAACGALPVANAPQFEFRLLYRTKYLKSFLPAIPFVGDSDE